MSPKSKNNSTKHNTTKPQINRKAITLLKKSQNPSSKRPSLKAIARLQGRFRTFAAIVLTKKLFSLVSQIIMVLLFKYLYLWIHIKKTFIFINYLIGICLNQKFKFKKLKLIKN